MGKAHWSQYRFVMGTRTSLRCAQSRVMYSHPTSGGQLNWALVVGAYVTRRVNPSDWDRYSLVVLNWYDNSTNPQPVQTTIEFRDMQVHIFV